MLFEVVTSFHYGIVGIILRVQKPERVSPYIPPRNNMLIIVKKHTLKLRDAPQSLDALEFSAKLKVRPAPHISGDICESSAAVNPDGISAAAVPHRTSGGRENTRYGRTTVLSTGHKTRRSHYTSTYSIRARIS